MQNQTPRNKPVLSLVEGNEHRFRFMTLGKVIAVAGLVLLASCGGGGGSVNSSNPTDTILSGIASKGLVANGTVTAYKIVNGQKGAILPSPNNTNPTKSSSAGNYSINLGTYSGSVLIEITGGSYKDEATGNTEALSSTLSAALANIVPNKSGATVIKSASVTPLTSAAVMNAMDSGGLTSTNIQKANDDVKALLGFDPVTSQPADATSSSSANSSNVAKEYAFVLGAISQYLKDNPTKTLDNAISDLATSFKSGGSGITGNTLFATSASNFGVNPNNQTGVSSMSALQTLSTDLATIDDEHAASQRIVAAALFKDNSIIQCPDDTYSSGNSCYANYNYNLSGMPGCFAEGSNFIDINGIGTYQKNSDGISWKQPGFSCLGVVNQYASFQWSMDDGRVMDGTHNGIDMHYKSTITNPKATFYAIAPGLVIRTGGGDFNTIAVYTADPFDPNNEDKGITTYYLHANQVESTLIAKVSKVNIGDPLGTQGHTGVPSDHVHISIRKGYPKSAICACSYDSRGYLPPVATALTFLTSVIPQFNATAGSALYSYNFDASTTSYHPLVISYSWNFGDGTVGSGVTITHTYSSSGSYTATLTVLYSDGIQKTTSQTIVVSAVPPLTPAFTVSFSGLQASFTASTSTPGANITSYAWSFGDGATATGITASHTYAAYSSTPWSVTLTVTDSYGRTASTSKNVSTTCPAGQVIQNGQCVTVTATSATCNGQSPVMGAWSHYGTASFNAATNTYSVGDTLWNDPSDMDGDCNIAARFGNANDSQDSDWLVYNTSTIGDIDFSSQACISQTSLSGQYISLATVDPAFTGLPGSGHNPFITGVASFGTSWNLPGKLLVTVGGGPWTQVQNATLSANGFCGTFRLTRVGATYSAYYNGTLVASAAATNAAIMPLVVTYDNIITLTPTITLSGTGTVTATVPTFTTSFSGLQASFTASTSTPGANITSYAWSFGDGATATGITASHTYAAYSSTPWSVTLTVTDNYGRTASVSQNVSATCQAGQVLQNGVCVPPTLMGSKVTLTIDYPALGTHISVPNTQTVMAGIEFPSGSLLVNNFNGYLIGSNVDVGATYIDIQYTQAALAASATFNGLVYDFDPSSPTIVGVSLNPLSTFNSSQVILGFGPHRVTINGQGLYYTTSSRILVDLVLAKP